MIGIIGTPDDVIGFGLAGIKLLHELPASASKEEVLSAIQRIGADCEAFIISDAHRRKVAEADFGGRVVITIPDDKKTPEDKIGRLAKELLGITLP